MEPDWRFGSDSYCDVCFLPALAYADAETLDEIEAHSEDNMEENPCRK